MWKEWEDEGACNGRESWEGPHWERLSSMIPRKQGRLIQWLRLAYTTVEPRVSRSMAEPRDVKHAVAWPWK